MAKVELIYSKEFVSHSTQDADRRYFSNVYRAAAADDYRP